MRNVILTAWLLLLLQLPGYCEAGKILVTMRKIGHEVLLASGDSTSWIMPIEEVDDRTFLIRFEHSFAFKPASLVEVINRHLRKEYGNLDYLVEVRQEKSNAVIYSYEIHPPLSQKEVACVSRTPPEGAYFLQIRFVQPPVQTASLGSYARFGWILLPLLLIGIGWRFLNRQTPALAPVEPQASASLVQLGSLTFCLEKQTLRSDKERIELSAKEAKLLKVFASSPNEVIDRDQLMKQVWEDEGVFVGRSLDVFVSRLRKKLQPASLVRIVNIHGRGYKLEIDSPLDCS